MTVQNAVELFSSEMSNEIYHLVSDETLQNILIDSISTCAKTVLDTHKAEKENR
ncbi:MAG: hypothetical protein OSJ52_06725 [Lachnospiraceae bacterium]|jgi:hypothetical protein|nr:hypothetical protein [Lachnospiraceae bacterium]